MERQRRRIDRDRQRLNDFSSAITTYNNGDNNRRTRGMHRQAIAISYR